jgi:hypothetical protein
LDLTVGRHEAISHVRVFGVGRLHYEVVIGVNQGVDFVGLVPLTPFAPVIGAAGVAAVPELHLGWSALLRKFLADRRKYIFVHWSCWPEIFLKKNWWESFCPEIFASEAVKNFDWGKFDSKFPKINL